MDREKLPFRIWIAEDDEELRETLGRTLAGEEREIRLFPDGGELVEALQRDPGFDIIIADLLMPGVDGLQVLEKSKKHKPDGLVIIMTGYASLDTAIQAIRGGAYDYIRKPFKIGELEVVVKNACDKVALVRENQRLLQKLGEVMPVPSFAKRGPSSTPDQTPPELDFLLKQMIPSDFDFSRRESLEKAFQHLQKAAEYRRDGLLSEPEFAAIKKRLFPFLPD